MRRNEACASFVAFAVRTQVIELSGGDGVFGWSGCQGGRCGCGGQGELFSTFLSLSLYLYLSASAKGIFSLYVFTQGIEACVY